MRVNLIANTSQFRTAMAESSQEIRHINSEFRTASAETDQYGNVLDNTGAKKKQLTDLIEQQRRRITAITQEQQHWTNELEKGNITEEEHAQKQQELATRLNNTEAQMKRYEGQLKRLNAEGKEATMTWEEFDTKFRDVGKTMRNVGAQVGIVAGAGFFALKRALSDIADEAMTFESGMAEVQAVSGATADEMKILTDQSKELGRETVFTAQQASEAQANLARAGFNVQEIYGAMPGMLDLAASSQLDLGQAADITSNILRAFNLEAEESVRVSDVLAKGAATANTDVQGLGQAFETAGPVANSLDVSIESLAASTGVMADAGIDGSKAGRMLRQGMLRLSKPTGEASDLIDELGINVFDADGNMRSMDKVVGELEKGMKDYDKQQRAAALSTIFGSESTAGWTALLEKGGKELESYTKELEDSEGAAAEMAETMQDTAEGATVRLESAISGLKIELGEHLLPYVADSAEYFADLATKMSELDDETVETAVQIALFTTAVLGVTTVVAGLVTAVGALMAFAGPIGLAITGGTLLLGGLVTALKLSTTNTERLKEEQKEAETQARRYGDGISEGTLEGVKGYVDLYEGAKLNMHKLKTMSGQEAEETKQLVVDSFREMGDEVVSELEKFAGEFGEVVSEIYGVYEEEGEKRSKEINEQVQSDVEDMITSYESASDRLAEIVDEFGGNVEKYPPEIRDAYEANLAIMQDGAQVFATTYEDALIVRNQIAENQDKIMFDEAAEWAGEIDKIHREGLESINEQYVEQAEVIEQFKILYPEHADIYDEMMQTLSTSTTAEYLKINEAREESLRVLHESVDEEGRLIDLSTGKELERKEVWENSVESGIIGMRKRAESDEEYYLRYLETSEAYLGALEETNAESLNRIEQNAYDWAIQMEYTEEEAREFAKNTRESVLEELEEGDERAGEAGKAKGDAFNLGLDGTVEGTFNTTSILVDGMLSELERGDGQADASGRAKGDAHRMGLEGTHNANEVAGSDISSAVSRALGSTTDDGGGQKAGTMFSRGIAGMSRSAEVSGASVSSSGERGLRSVDTSGAGGAFVTGFSSSISAGSGIGSSVWNAAWSVGRSALRSLRNSIDTGSPSRETANIGVDYVKGFSLAIDDEAKDAMESSREMGRQTLGALSEEVEGNKHSFAKIALGIEESKQSLKVEHSLDDRFRELIETENNKDEHTKKMLEQSSAQNELLIQQNSILMQLLQKNSDVYIDDRIAGRLLEPVITEIQGRTTNTNDRFK